MSPARRGWPIPAALLVLSVIPVGASLYRLADLAFAVPVAASARFHAVPIPVALHLAGAAVFMVLGALQLVPALRGRPWHRRAGRVAVVAGLAAALAGLWMTGTFPATPGNSDLLFGFRITAAVAWVVFLIFAVAAIRAGDVVRHRAFMLRALAMAFGAGTTVLTFGLWYGLTGTDTPVVNALAQAAAWAINLTIAEIAIARAHPRRAIQTV